MDLSRVVIESVRPQVDGGRHRAKAVVGDRVEVTADVFRDGFELLRAVVRFKGPHEEAWNEAPLVKIDEDNDRWAGAFAPEVIGRWAYTVAAWTDRFATYRRDLRARVDAGQDVELELEEGASMLEAALPRADGAAARALRSALATLRNERKPVPQRARALLDDGVAEVMAAAQERGDVTEYEPVLELTVDRELARFGAWYEFFPRSTGRPGQHGTFQTAARALPRIADMGFDVVYLPPIHPIGTTNRKGRNNSLVAEPGDVGVPWAVGGPEGGHRSVHPQLGTLDDFDDFVRAARRLELEVALDLALQCSPDHPWVKEHPDWFMQRPDGTIRYAENPPKKYQDVYPINFDTEDKEALWTELKDVVEFWVSHGVKIFRVDNPHTKPLPFWEWLIEEVQGRHPDVIFLSEAFTRLRVQQALAKLGFTQSYTYFTWKNTKEELTEYLTLLTRTEMADYFRPNFFTNTQDILHEYLQRGGRPAFKVRLVLAALLSPSYGIYSGYELCENVPLRPGTEEYLDSEKYQLVTRDWDAPGNLAGYIKRINDLRRSHRALSRLTNLHFHDADDDSILAFSKSGETGAGDAKGSERDAIVAIVNLDPASERRARVTLDLEALGLPENRSLQVHDVISGRRQRWRGATKRVRLDPRAEPAAILRVRA